MDEAARLRIADALGDVRARTVVEVGPGHGAITGHLARHAKRLHCVEFDPSLARELAFRFRNDPHVSVHHADILQTDLQPFAAGEDGTACFAETAGAETRGAEVTPPLDVVGNLPYYITSDILLHLFAAARAGLLRRAILMVQREVADRVAAEPGSSDYGALSAVTQLHAEVTPLFILPPEAFSPPPDVFSTVLRLDFAPRFEELGVPFEGFNRFLRSTFAQKRKTLANNLRAAGFPAASLTAAWPAVLPAQARAETVSLPLLAELYGSLVDAGALPPPTTGTPAASST